MAFDLGGLEPPTSSLSGKRVSAVIILDPSHELGLAVRGCPQLCVLRRSGCHADSHSAAWADGLFVPKSSHRCRARLGYVVSMIMGFIWTADYLPAGADLRIA